MRPGRGASSTELRVFVAGDETDILHQRLGDAGVVFERVEPDRLAEIAGAAGDEEPLPLLVPLRGPDDVASVREVRRALPAYPVIGVIVDPASLDGSAAREAGCDGVLTLQECEAARLAEAIVQAAERRSLLFRAERLSSRLEAAELRFHNTVQRVADGIMILHESGRIRFANAAAEGLFGQKSGGLIGQEFGYPVAAGETTEIDIVRGDEEPGVAELRVTRTEWDEEPCLLVSVRDVTRQRRAEERERELIREQLARREAETAAERNEFLAEASRKLYSSLEADQILWRLVELVRGRIGDVCLVDTLRSDHRLPEQRIVLGGEEGPATDVAEVLREKGIGAVPTAAVDRVLETGEAVAVEAPEELGGGSLLLAPLSVEGGVVALLALVALRREAFGGADTVLARELVRRASLALENARLLRLSRQASRAKSDFLNVVSHELRTPLTGITGYVGLLEEGLAGPVSPGQLRYLRGIGRNSDQLLRIIDQILLYADTEEDREEVRLVEEPLGDLLEDVVSLARPMARREGLELRVRAPEGDVRVRTDARKLRQIVLHLLANAVKFTREGSIELRVDVEPDQLVVEVTDTGIGIPEEKHGEIFEAFTQVESSETRVAGGTGIGLNVVRNLTRMLGGSIRVRSAPGEGSTFTVSLPLGGG